MAKTDKYSLLDLRKDFPNDSACLDFLFKTLHSSQCSCGGTYRRLEDRLQYQCSKCRFQIAPMVGTIFEKSPTPLTLWFHAIFIFSNAKSGISAKEMERQLGVTYKTAWRILSRIRESLTQSTEKLKGGDVEMDEAWIGGRKKAGKNNKNLSEAVLAKSVVMGAIQRKGEARVKMTKYGATAVDTKNFLESTIDPTGTRLLTDQSNRYDKAAGDYNRESVNHGRQEYVRGDVHVNNVETFWSHVKRSLKGTHKSVSRQHLQSYLDAFVWHYNNRRNDRARFEVLLGAVLLGAKR